MLTPPTLAQFDALALPPEAFARAPVPVAVSGQSFSRPGGAYHQLLTGDPFEWLLPVNSAAALPPPLVVAVDYYAIADTMATFRVASTQANALAGTAITITGAGVAGYSFGIDVTPILALQLADAWAYVLDCLKAHSDPIDPVPAHLYGLAARRAAHLTSAFRGLANPAFKDRFDAVAKIVEGRDQKDLDRYRAGEPVKDLSEAPTQDSVPETSARSFVRPSDPRGWNRPGRSGSQRGNLA